MGRLLLACVGKPIAVTAGKQASGSVQFRDPATAIHPVCSDRARKPRPLATEPAISGFRSNGTIRNLLRAASSTFLKTGLWLPTIISLSCGTNSNSSWRMKRALIRSPPVSCLMRLSGHALPCSVSEAVTTRAPHSLAISVRCRSLFDAVKVSIEDVAAYCLSMQVTTFRKTDFPLPPGP
jgi:hypothetical protein